MVEDRDILKFLVVLSMSVTRPARVYTFNTYVEHGEH